MKSKIRALLAVGLLALSSAGNAAVVTISGWGAADGSWNVTTVTGSLFGSHDPTAQAWWGNSGLANAFSQALGGSLAFPNACSWCDSSLAPFFAWQTQTTAIGPIFDARAMSSLGTAYNFQASTGAAFTFAVAERVTTSPPGSPVPLPAAAWLLLSGLGGLGLLRRRKAN